MFFLNEPLNPNQQITAMVTLLTTTCGAGLFALIALVVVALVAVVCFGSRCVAIMGEHRTPGAPLSTPSDPGMNPLPADAHRLRGTLLAAPGLEVMR